jgi:Domain of unknown function (DUF4249)
MCKDKFNAKIDYPNTGYLVVEGFLNSGKGRTEIKLSRSLPLTDTTETQEETGAHLNIETHSGNFADLVETAPGRYTCGQLNVDYSDEYRLHIFTNGGNNYYSDFVKPIKSPPIDKLKFIRSDKGVEINVVTHDPTNATRYYTWRFDETWEIDAQYRPTAAYIFDSTNHGRVIGTEEFHPPDTGGLRCWKYDHSNTILTGSSIKLSEDVIDAPLNRIEPISEKLGVLYHIRVFQHGLSAAGYDFFQRLKKNTEETGSIFTSQPSELNSNVHNATNSEEPVFGFIDMADQDSADFFISKDDVPGWGYAPDCDEFVIFPRDDLDTLNFYSGYYPVTYTVWYGAPALFVAPRLCVNCRLAGSNVKPPYWPF